jgi:pilus assembly protein FimV
LHTLTQGKGEHWQKAATLGQRLLPGNMLFSDSEITEEVISADMTIDPLQVTEQAVGPHGSTPMEGKSIAERAADIATRAVEARGAHAQPPVKDFTFSMGTVPAQDDLGVDLDLEELSRFKHYGQTEERVDIKTRPQQSDIDFNLDDFDSPPQVEMEKEPVRWVPSLTELDFSDDDSIAEDQSLSTFEGQWHDAATKLDLARAYQATGDIEACHEILQEVLQEGDDQQKSEANAILKGLPS